MPPPTSAWVRAIGRWDQGISGGIQGSRDNRCDPGIKELEVWSWDQGIRGGILGTMDYKWDPGIKGL